MSEALKLSIELPASPEAVYHAWLDSDKHAAFTGSPAHIDPVVGGKYEAWDGYISGVTRELQPPHRIVQTWRTTEFPKNAPDSLLEVLLEPIGKGAGRRPSWHSTRSRESRASTWPGPSCIPAER
jgi:uncharacterized protein YndB with AHSA1/START domain